MEPRDLTHDLPSRDWQEYADACLCHDSGDVVVVHACELAHEGEHLAAA